MYDFTDNAMESGVAVCDTDVANSNLMHLKYSDKSDFISEAPNGVLSANELTITAANGLKVAIPNGKDSNGAYKSTVIKLTSAATLTISDEYDGESVFIDSTGALTVKAREEAHSATITTATASDTYLYNSKTNLYYDNSGNTVAVAELGQVFSTSSAITSIISKDVFRSTDYREFATKWVQALAELQAEKEEIDAARDTLDRLYQGVNLATKFASEIANYTDQWAWIKARIQAGNYEGIHVGDYLPFTLNSGTVAGTVVASQDFNAEIAGIDTYYGYGDTAVGHHIDFVTKTVIDSPFVWNPNDNNNGTSTVPQPWLSSAIYAVLNGVNNYAKGYNNVYHGANASSGGIFQLLPQALRNVIITKRQILGQRYSGSGLLTYDTTWAWGDMGKLWLPNEVEVYGCEVWGAAHYNGGTYAFESMGAVQYPLFACHGGYNGRVKCKSDNSRATWWLSAVRGGTSAFACNVYYYGFASNNSASNATICAPVCFRIG